MHRFPLFFKILMICLLTFLLLVPLSMIESKISERHALQNDVLQDIAHSASGPQTLAGPYLVLSYNLREHHTYKDDKGIERVSIVTTGPYEVTFSPRTLNVAGNADIETRNRGIYQARLFTLHSTVDGAFDIPRGYGTDKPLEDIIPLTANFVVNVSDARGIRNTPTLSFDSSQYEFAPGGVKAIAGNGIHAALTAVDPAQAHVLQFNYPFDLQGLSTLSVVPTGNRMEMTLRSPWPHPSFGGSFLPLTRSVNTHGFSAQWVVTNLARNEATQADGKTPLSAEAFSVDFIDPVDVYLLSERAVKYGIMFVVLVFTAFFMFEILRGLRIHPMQYLLVGLSMAMFFLLIISLSEHMPFLAAYVIAGAACVALIGVYLAGALKERKPALAFSAGIALLYTVLYGVLQSEDNALLMGALLMFCALTAVMLLTRRTDWNLLSSTSSTQRGI